ncbi:MAG: hypothetical protein LBT83_05035 [Tannerella sp.]|jgi:signal transduction histidine kinase|nr:hypothetical protein [Tannerella sp.]
MKINYRRKFFLYFFALFILFTFGILFFDQFRYFIPFFFALVSYLIYWDLSRFDRSIRQLRDFTIYMENEYPFSSSIPPFSFPNDELGEIGTKMVYIINDITCEEKTRRLKREITDNITHELRTPVTGIRGCLETILTLHPDAEKKDRFIQNAYRQVLILSELIQDMSLITKIEDAPQSFRLEPIRITDLLCNIRNDFTPVLKQSRILMEWNVPDTVIVKGNRNLIHSIFRNLTDNVIRHAGHNIRILINQYREDRNFYYFSYSDTGVGISDEQHLSRLFERFYRVSEGRTRDTGGSGLGLSIVKNAVVFHRGTIIVKNKKGGGLEFLFKLPKDQE